MSIDKNKVYFLREEDGDGQGTFFYSDGDKYEGEWKDGKIHGLGTLTFLNNVRKWIGEFREGSPWDVLDYKDGEIVGKWINGMQKDANLKLN